MNSTSSKIRKKRRSGQRKPIGSSGRSRKKTRTTKLAHQPATDHPKVEGVAIGNSDSGAVGNSLNIDTGEVREKAGYSELKVGSHNTHTRKNSQLSSPVRLRPGRWFSKNSSSSRERLQRNSQTEQLSLKNIQKNGAHLHLISRTRLHQHTLIQENITSRINPGQLQALK